MTAEEFLKNDNSYLIVSHNTNITDKEYKEIMALISVIGYQFLYINPHTYMDDTRNIVP